ncbi:MAG: radical SAM family heme chaperone HemW [Armatimonadetes bacterium]|nr:radical SAM family heme chaperone HemW [Armatimonadota bacterium]
MSLHEKMVSDSLAIYVHIPFCTKHCAYCDFNTYVEKAQSEIVGDTVEAICADIRQTAKSLNAEQRSRSIGSVFFGGGTPTFLSGEQITHILKTIRSSFVVQNDAEISSEANPTSSDSEKFGQMREAGFNRLSVGVQAFQDPILIAMDRFHTANEAEHALQTARTAGFDNLNLDLMFGLPKQRLSDWEESLQRALALETEHLSLYALTLEAGTRFERLYAGGKLELPGEDAETEMYERAIEILTSAGYQHYEVSNFALEGYQCRHNRVYWENREYIGFGAGAVSYLDGRRWKRERLPAQYIRKVREGLDLSVESETLEPEGTLGETMMLGLRLRDGISLSKVQARFGIEPLSYFAEPIADLERRGWLVRDEDTLKLSHAGLLLANEAVSAFLAD